LGDERPVDHRQRVPVGHRRQRRRALEHQRLPVFTKHSVRAECRVVYRTQRPLHRSVPAQPRAAFQRTRVHLHVRNLETDWTDRAAVAYATAALFFAAERGDRRVERPATATAAVFLHLQGRPRISRWTTTYRPTGTWFAARPVRSAGSAISSPTWCRRCFCRCSERRRRDGDEWWCR